MDGMGGSIGGAAAPGNPYGLSPSTLALMGGLSGLSNTLNPTSASSANYMRPSAGMAYTPGQPGALSLLDQILQMRQQASMALGDPYQPGVAPPRISLLGG
jgi:hypothetical protein